MVRVTQTKFGVRGNCLASCIASILNTSIENIPNVETLFSIKGEFEGLWSLALEKFLEQYKITWEILDIDPLNPPREHKYTYLLVVADGIDSKLPHYVIYRGGKQYHDPAPNKSGIDESNIQQVSCLFLNLSENEKLSFAAIFDETENFVLSPFPINYK